MRIFVLIILQMIRIVVHFSEWDQVLVSRRLGGVKMLKDINILVANYGHSYNDVSLCISYDVTGKREFRLMQGHASALLGCVTIFKFAEAGLGLQDVYGSDTERYKGKKARPTIGPFPQSAPLSLFSKSLLFLLNIPVIQFCHRSQDEFSQFNENSLENLETQLPHKDYDRASPFELTSVAKLCRVSVTNVAKRIYLGGPSLE
jgi:hypothetical protein